MRPEDPASPEEREAAARLQRALDGSAEGADPESVAAIRLLSAVRGAGGADELAARRLRAELVSRARRKGLVRRYRLFAAAAATLLLAAGGLYHARPRPPDAATLASREREAREALARLEGGASGSPFVVLAEWRQEELANGYRLARFDELLKKRTEDMLEARERVTASPSPTPGGAS